MKKTSKFRITLTAKIVMFIMFISLLVLGLVSVMNYYKYKDAVYNVHSDYARKICENIKDYLSEEEWQELSASVYQYQYDELSDEDIEDIIASDMYQGMYERVQNIVSDFGLENAAVFYVDKENMDGITKDNFNEDDSYTLFMLVDCYAEDNELEGLDYGVATNWWDNFEDFSAYRDILYSVIDNQDDVAITEDVEGGRAYLTDYYPIVHNDEVLAIIQISGDAIEINDFMHSFFRETLLTGLFVALGLILFAVAYFYFRMIRPLKIIRAEAESFVKNNTEISKKLGAIRTHDEIQDLSESFLHMEHDLQDYIKKVEQVTEENARISTELSVATKIQMDMLPTVFPPFPDRNEFKIYASMNPAKEVGGDFYDFFFIDEDKLALVIADVSGKGVPAALFMSISKSLVKNRAKLGGTPSEILYDVNNQLCDGNDEGLFVTLWMAIIDLSTGEGVAANAGHEHPVRADAKGNYQLVCYRHSIAMATFEGVPYKQHNFSLQPGDRIFVYTDGLVEAINTSKEAYGTDRFIKLLNENENASPEELLKKISDDVNSFKGEEPQFDDLTMLMFEYIGKN